MADHIREGKKHFNFLAFTSYTIFKQYGKLKQMIDEVKSGAMPLTSYTLVHTNARLTGQQKSELADWAASTRKQIENNYPPDSLVKKKSRSFYLFK